MQSELGQGLVKAFKLLIAFTPWVLACYAFYLLHTSGTWTGDTPHRGKMSVTLLGTGMVLSFLIQSRFIRNKGKQAVE
jgi:hypothetical protein